MVRFIHGYVKIYNCEEKILYKIVYGMVKSQLFTTQIKNIYGIITDQNLQKTTKK